MLVLSGAEHEVLRVVTLALVWSGERSRELVMLAHTGALAIGGSHLSLPVEGAEEVMGAAAEFAQAAEGDLSATLEAAVQAAEAAESGAAAEAAKLLGGA